MWRDLDRSNFRLCSHCYTEKHWGLAAFLDVENGPVSNALPGKAAKQVVEVLLYVTKRAEISTVLRYTSC